MSAPTFLESPALSDLAGIRHGFFGRQGGVSTGLYASLNAGPGSGDDPGAVAMNRARIATALDLEHLVSCYQVHGREVVEITAAAPHRPRADAMVTDRPGIGLAILTADCVPVLFADPQRELVGAAHAGWRGALAGVCEATVERLVRRGADPRNIRAAIGPAIQQASYEVGPEFHETFLAADADSATYFLPGAGGRLLFDLTGYVAQRLERLGLGAIDRLVHDTCAQEEMFFSNRRRTQRGEADYGRNASLIALVPA